MRSIVLAAVAATAVSPGAHAQAWKEYIYPVAGFSLHFPTEPKVETRPYAAALDEGAKVSVPSTVYSARYDGSVYTATVADLSGRPSTQGKVIDHAVETLRGDGAVQFSSPVSIANGDCGRYLGIVGKDGSQSVAAVFFPNASRRLYVIQARIPKAKLQTAAADGLHFQQSVSFIADPKAEETTTTADAQGWKEYAYPDIGFAVRLPAEPKVETSIYKTGHGVAVVAVTYSAADYRVTIADLWRTPADQPDAIDRAVEQLKSTGAIKSDLTISIANGQCGRDLTLVDAAGSPSAMRVYFPSSSHRLYIVQAKGDPQSADVARFRRSFRFFRVAESE